MRALVLASPIVRFMCALVLAPDGLLTSTECRAEQRGEGVARGEKVGCCECVEPSRRKALPQLDYACLTTGSQKCVCSVFEEVCSVWCAVVVVIAQRFALISHFDCGKFVWTSK